MKKIGFVTPWYGKNIPGGAEMELRGIAQHLHHAGIEVEILTTCVKEFRSDWNVNYYKIGMEFVEGLPVRRFSVRKRNVESFDQVNYKLINNIPISSDEELIYIQEMINSIELYSYMENHQDEYDLFVFIPYMFGTTYYGIEVCPDKAVMIPCFHDESYIYMDIYKPIFSKVRGIIFNAQPEQKLANRIFNLSNVKQELIGIGIDSNFESIAERFEEKYNIKKPFILYAGRKDEGKNVHTLIQYFCEYKKRIQNDLQLVLIGGGMIQIPVDVENDIYDLGFVDAKDKYDAYAAATVLCQPSKNESFSLVIMESWLAKRPVLVNGDCAVTKSFVTESNGGLYFYNYYEFEGCINYILQHAENAQNMGIMGQNYVLERFTWDVITDKYVKFFKEIIGEKTDEENSIC